jgi:hypothetical protein
VRLPNHFVADHEPGMTANFTLVPPDADYQRWARARCPIGSIGDQAAMEAVVVRSD